MPQESLIENWRSLSKAVRLKLRFHCYSLPSTGISTTNMFSSSWFHKRALMTESTVSDCNCLEEVAKRR